MLMERPSNALRRTWCRSWVCNVSRDLFSGHQHRYPSSVNRHLQNKWREIIKEMHQWQNENYRKSTTWSRIDTWNFTQKLSRLHQTLQNKLDLTYIFLWYKHMRQHPFVFCWEAHSFNHQPHGVLELVLLLDSDVMIEFTNKIWHTVWLAWLSN